LNITIVLPAYNEADDLPPLLERMGEALAAEPAWRVLVVDDGSTDATADRVLAAAARLPVELIRHPRNRGLGAAIRTGLRSAARADGAVVTLDADNTHDPALIPGMVHRLEQGFDVVIASRYQPGGAEIGVSAFRKLLSHTASGALRAVVRYPGVRDYTCGYRAYRAETLRTLIGAFGDGFVRENGFACMLEILLNLRRIDARVTEVPLPLRYDLKSGPTKIRIARTVWRYGVTLTRGLLPLAVQDARPGARPL
jgi:dolichol-phosphate mannosyltransferase